MVKKTRRILCCVAILGTCSAFTVSALENGLARTPPMGWNSWNCFGPNIDETKIKGVADALVSTGLRDAGYIYLNLDDNWMAKSRDANGNLQGDPTRFPSGMKALGDYIHSKGLKFGIYGDRGTVTCYFRDNFKELKTQKLKTKMLLQVHDELVFEVPKEELETSTALIQKLMTEALQLRIPLAVDIKYGKSWYEAH